MLIFESIKTNKPIPQQDLAPILKSPPHTYVHNHGNDDRGNYKISSPIFVTASLSKSHIRIDLVLHWSVVPQGGNTGPRRHFTLEKQN